MLIRELREDEDAVVVIGQASHAWLSGQLARAWGNDRFAGPSPREEVCLAAEQHDVGMAHWDLAPTLNPETGRPVSFMEMELDEHLRLWSLAPSRLLTQSRYAALLVSLHGSFLYERRDLGRLDTGDADAVRSFLAGQRVLQQRLAAELGVGQPEMQRNQRLIFTWDALSLAVCLGWPSYTAASVPTCGDEHTDLNLTKTDDDRFAIAPWPFETSSPLTVRCEGRRLVGRHETAAQLHAALEAAEHVEVRVTLTKG